MESRLIAQSAVFYEFAIESFAQCGSVDGLDHIEAMANLGIKLMGAHNEIVDAFN